MLLAKLAPATMPRNDHILEDSELFWNNPTMVVESLRVQGFAQL